jgi:hypothetical protein
MRVMNEMTGEPVGHLADISTTGFKLDCTNPLPPETNITLRIEQIGNITDKNFVVFTARAKWCKRDEFDVKRYNVGFQLVNISRNDYDVFVKMYDVYGVPKDENLSSTSYM